MRWLTFANGARFPEFLFQFKRRDRTDAVIEQVTQCPLFAQTGRGLVHCTCLLHLWWDDNRFRIKFVIGPRHRWQRCGGDNGRPRMNPTLSHGMIFGRRPCDVPNWQQPRGFVTKTALRCSTPIKSRLTIFDGGPPCAAKPLLFTRWDNPLLYAWTAPRQRLSPRRHIGVTCGDSRAPRWADAPVNDGLFVRRVCLTAES